MSSKGVMEASSSSKVTVEYHDPSGIFPLIAPDIGSHLPLRNLNWQAPSRPLRQIKSLHVELVPDKFTESLSERPELKRLDSQGQRSIDIIRSGAQANRGPVKERRHQIPGLRQTPYLRVYLLRCDDKDTYKSSARQHLRDWIRENTSSHDTKSAKSKRDDHDASEWLILHIVLPDTQESAESRWRAITDEKKSDEFKERPTGKSKWPGRNTRSVFDKLRADFNSSKSEPDRVAQIRLQKDKVRLAEILPGAPVFENYIETQKEQDEAWNDVVTKLKTLILVPFDLRVRQYEDDIAENDARRSLPGWNFCTFFILKEGLARGLESVGLVEDALAIYDELHLGFETVLRDLAADTAQGSATSFTSYTDDIKQRILQSTYAAASSDKPTDQILGLFNKDYRERIVTSNISVFDFMCYIFSRQKALLLRMGRARSSHAQLNGGARDNDHSHGEDLTYFAQVCKRAVTFIHTNSRILQQDLRNGTESILTRESDINVENLACSWTFSVAGSILDETRTSHLQGSETTTADQSHTTIHTKGAGANPRNAFKFAMGADPYPQRSSSLQMRKPKPAPEPQRPQSSQVVYENGVFSPPPSRGGEHNEDTPGRPGLTDLASLRAELFITQRKVLELLAKRRSWETGWAAAKKIKPLGMDDVDLTNGDEREGYAKAVEQEIQRSSKLLSATLNLALKSEEEFRQAYGSLSDMAIRSYLAAGHPKAAETLMGDIAMVIYQAKDYANAANYFQQIIPLYGVEKWTFVEAETLGIYADCLKQLHRRDEYMRTILSLLAKVCARKTARELPNMRLSETDDASGGGWFDDGLFDASGYLPDLIKSSEDMPYEVTAGMEVYFSDIQLNREVEHHIDRDGFKLHLRFRHILDDEIELDQVSVRLVHMDDPTQEIWLVQSGPLQVCTGVTQLALESIATTFGPYLVDKVVLTAKKLRFVHELQPPPPKANVTPLGITYGEAAPRTTPSGRPFVFLYPPKDAFNVEMSVIRNIHIDKARSIVLVLNSGWNEVESVDLRLKPASAGLRLHLGDATLTGMELRESDGGRPGIMELGKLASHNTAQLDLPYSLESQPQDVTIRLEAAYHTANGSFSFISSVRIPVELSLDVDVHDIFHHSALYSNFSIRTTKRSPLLVTHAQLEDSAVYTVQAPPSLPTPMAVLEGQPVRLMYKISRSSIERTSVIRKEAALALTIRYHSVDELVHEAIVNLFRCGVLESKHDALERLLVPLLRQRVQIVIEPQEYEQMISHDAVRVPSYDQLGWDDIVLTLPGQYRESLIGWLRGWHESNQYITLKAQSTLVADPKIERSITLSVEVPTLDVVHSVSLNLDLPETSLLHPPIVVLGHAITAELRIKHSRRWSTASIFGAQDKSKDDTTEPLEFSFDILADTDTWLIAGQRHARFSASEDKELTFSLALIPLRQGTHLLPTVEIQPAVAAAVDGEKATQQSDKPQITCETNLESAGEVVQVISGVHETSISIADAADAGGVAASRSETRDSKEEYGMGAWKDWIARA